jgi:hypothetical protein
MMYYCSMFRPSGSREKRASFKKKGKENKSCKLSHLLMSGALLAGI